MLELYTIEGWSEDWWHQAEPIYDKAFPKEGRKTDRVIRSLLERGVGALHVLKDENMPVAMAITGIVEKGKSKALLIDYAAVAVNRRGEGIGLELVLRLKQQATDVWKLDFIVIEIESDETPENVGRLRFWQRCGFRETPYIHQYIWVPEPYLAMYAPLRPEADRPMDGETLFGYITQFHKRAYGR